MTEVTRKQKYEEKLKEIR